MDKLNTEQKKAAEFQGKHLLVLAGAGTGKTKTIIARAEYLLKNNVSPRKIAILSFTRKSAAEIAERLKSSVGSNIDKQAITGKTFHSWCYEIMHSYPEFFPHHNYTPLDEADMISAIGLAIGKNFKDSRDNKIKKESVARIYSYAMNTLCSLSDAIKHIRYNHLDRANKNLEKYIEEDRIKIAPVIKNYIEYKRVRKYMDYDDMLNVVATVLEKNEKVRNVVTARYEHVLVDEMQDTNPLQYKLLRSFVDNSHLFCVGDDAQSIYGFRGADFKTIHAFANTFPQSEVQKLILNYRSTQEILNLSNWLLARSPLNYDKKLEAYRGSGNLPNLIHVHDDWEEANIITDKILESVFQNNDSYGDNMVLGRSSWALAKVEASCLQKKIPYVKYGGTSLMQSAHVRDVTSAMRIIANNYDELAWMRFLQLWHGIGEVTATKIITDILFLSTFEEIVDFLNNSAHRSLIKEIPDVLVRVHQHIDNPSEAMKAAVDSMKEIMRKKYESGWVDRKTDFEVLQEVAKASGSITEFITEYVLDPKAETTLKVGVRSPEDVVILSTIHSAKGLEAKNVHVTNVNPYAYPNSQSIAEGLSAVEEERRTLYVALTRAKDELNVYRNIKSMHTQTFAEWQSIKIGGKYVSKEDEELQVTVLGFSENTVIYQDVRAAETDGNLSMHILEFKKLFQKIELYFLDNLPSELVNIVAHGTERNFPAAEDDIDSDMEFDFPDFDFN